MTVKDVLQAAIDEARILHDVTVDTAKDVITESITPSIKSMLAAKLLEMEQIEEEEITNENFNDLNFNESEDEESNDDKADEEEPTNSSPQAPELEVPIQQSPEIPQSVEVPTTDPENSMDSILGSEGEEEEEVNFGELTRDDIKDIIKSILFDITQGITEPEPTQEIAPAEQVQESEDSTSLNLEELLSEDDIAEEEVNESTELETVKAELKEAKETLEKVTKQIKEVNLLDAKLIYLSKVYKTQNLTEAQKISIMEAFDKAETVKEAKLVYDTITENFISKVKTPIREQRSIASNITGTTSQPQINETIAPSSAITRMQQLAGIKLKK